jgi:hypothetical protein
MCWNAAVSLQTFMIGIIGILYAYINKYPFVELLFFFSFTLMQLIEYYIWIYINNRSINKLLSIATILLIGIQPIISILTIYRTYNTISKYLLFVYILAAVITIMYIDLEIFKTYRGKNGHLVWGWLTKDKINIINVILYFVCLFLPLLLSGKYELLIFGLSTLVISLYYYIKYDTWGSMWCWLVNFWVMIVVIINILIKR